MFDTIVIGLGGMGSATACHLARRGQKVLGLEQFNFLHDRGSSHGESRIIRQAYFEHPDYVPLLQRAYEYWKDLDSATGLEIIDLCGMFLAGYAGDTVISGTRLAAATHGLPLEDVPPAEALKRFPNLRVGADMDILFDPLGGYLCVENCVDSHLSAARQAGAELHELEAVLRWERDGAGVRVTTSKSAYLADSLVITAGPWASALLSELALPLARHRAVMAWFQPETELHDADTGAPVFGIQTRGGFFYGFPRIGRDGVKVALHQPGARVNDPDNMDRMVTDDDVRNVRAFAAEHMVDLKLDSWRGKTCIYTMTPDEHFIVDRHPHHDHVFFAAGFSGHGFKFTPVIGSILADYCTLGKTSEPADFLRLGRFENA